MGSSKSKLKKKDLEKMRKETNCKRFFKQFLKIIQFEYDFSHETGNRRFVAWVWKCILKSLQSKNFEIFSIDKFSLWQNFQSQFQEEFRSFCPKGLLTRKALTSIYAKNFPDGDPTHFANIGLIFYIFYQELRYNGLL